MSALHAFRTLVVSPAAFFEDRPPAETLPIAIGCIALFAVCLAGSILLVGSLLAGAVDATVMMDNPDRPPEPICDQYADTPDSAMATNCDEPRTIERDAGEMVREAATEYGWVGLVGPAFLWVCGTVVLFGAGRIAGGSPSLGGTAALAGWAAVPEFFRLGVGLAALWLGLPGVRITDPESAPAVVASAMAPLEPMLLVATLLTAGWQLFLLAGGLSRDADLPWGRAAVAVGIPLGLFVLATL